MQALQVQQGKQAVCTLVHELTWGLKKNSECDMNKVLDFWQ